MERVLTSETDARTRKRAKQDEKQQAAMERADLENVLSTASGRRFLWKMLVEAGVFRLSFVAGAADSTAFNEGRRAQGNALMARIQALDPEHYHRMAKEAHAIEEATKPVETEEAKPLTESEETEHGN